MNENNVDERDMINILEDTKNIENIYLRFEFNIELNDYLLMNNICLLMKNSVDLIENGEMEWSDVDEIMTFDYVCKSIKELLDNRIHQGNSKYIKDAYNWCMEHQEYFDMCLDYFKKIKDEILEIKNKIILNHALTNLDDNPDQGEQSTSPYKC